MDYKEIYNQWLENPYFDEATKEELKAEIETQKAMFYLQQQDSEDKETEQNLCRWSAQIAKLKFIEQKSFYGLQFSMKTKNFAFNIS